MNARNLAGAPAAAAFDHATLTCGTASAGSISLNEVGTADALLLWRLEYLYGGFVGRAPALI